MSAAPVPLKSPYPYFGGKSIIASVIWQALGNTVNFVDPFAGSLAVLLGRPHPPQLETVNDACADIPNFWRALQRDPEGLAALCDTPVFEVDQHAFHTWLLDPERTTVFVARLMGDPDYYDLVRAARWCAGLCMWIGGGWCSGEGPWHSVDGQLVHAGDTAGNGVKRRIVHLGDQGQGVHRRRVHLRNAGVGVHRQRVHLGGVGGSQDIHAAHARGDSLYDWFAALQARLRYVRVCCGDWTRVMGPSVTWKHGLTGIVLDPPYSAEEGRDPGIYANDDLQVAHSVRAWCLANGKNKLLRIVLCGYGNVHDELLSHGWRRVEWMAQGGMGWQGHGRGRENRHRETLWLSPACLRTEPEHQLRLFA